MSSVNERGTQRRCEWPLVVDEDLLPLGVIESRHPLGAQSIELAPQIDVPAEQTDSSERRLDGAEFPLLLRREIRRRGRNLLSEVFLREEVDRHRMIEGKPSFLFNEVDEVLYPTIPSRSWSRLVGSAADDSRKNDQTDERDDYERGQRGDPS